MNEDLKILTVSLFQLDLERNTLKNIPVDVDADDLVEYLDDILVEVNADNKNRSFEFDRDTLEVYVYLKNIFSLPELSKHENGKTIAARLLATEIATDKKYGHLSSKGKHVKRGSYLQFIYQHDGVIKYLGVKVEHQGYLDESDLKKHIGLALINKVYKAFRVCCKNGDPGEVDVYDSQAVIAKYWWHSFLELTELRSDAFNTKEACQWTMTKINQIKRLSLDDYKALRNATIVAFKQDGAMDYLDFIKNTIESYLSDKQKVNDKLKKLVPELKKLPDTKGFDNLFNLDASAVPYKKSTYKLSSQITLTVDEGIHDFDNKIWSEITADGDEVVVIKSPEGFKEFKQKIRVL